MADTPIFNDVVPVEEDWSKIDRSNQPPKVYDDVEPFQLTDQQQKVLQKNQQMVQTAVPAVMQEAAFGQRQRKPKRGSNWDVIKSQFGQSTLGLLGDRAASIGQEGPYKYKPEDVVEPEGFLQEALGMGAQVLGDLPSYIVYGAPGLLAGPAGGRFLSPTLAMGGTEFTKSLLRQEDMPTALKHGGKGGLTGLAMGSMGAMGLPAKYVPSIRPAMKKLALPMEIAGGAAVSSGLEGKPLELKDIALMALPVAGIHTATKTTSAAANLISRRRRNALAESKLAQAEAMPADTPEQQTKKLEAIKGAEALRSQAFEKKAYEAGARPFEPTEEEELKKKREAEAEKGTVKISEEDTAGKRRRKKVGETGDFDGLPFGDMISDQMKSEREALKKKVKEDAAAERRRLKEERIALKQAEKEKRAAVEKQAMVPEKVIEETQRQAQQLVDNATGRPVQEQVERLSRRKRQQQEREESIRLRDAYEQHLDTLDLTPEGKAESLKDFDNLKHEGGINAQRDRISSIYTPDPAVAPTAEQIAAAQAVKAKVESDHLESNRAKRIADIQLLKDNGWDEAQIAEMDEKSLTAALRKVRNYRTDLLSKTPEEIDRMLEYEMSVAEMYDRIGSENPPSDMEMVEILKMAQALDITPINDVAQEAIRRQGQEENPLSYAEINKKRRDLIAESAQRMMAQKAAAEAAIPKTEPIAKTVIRRRAGQEQRLGAEQKIAQRRRGQTEQEPVSAKEEALRKLIEEQEADRLAQEEGRAFGEESIEDLRVREEERERQGYGPYDWEDRSVALSTHGDVVEWLSRSKVGEFVEGLKFSLDGLKEVGFKEYQAEAKSVVNTFMQNLRKGIMPSLYDKQMALIRVYRIIPRGEREMAMWKDAIDTIESFSGEIPRGADQFSLRSIAEAYKDGLLTADEARHLNELMGRLRERPTFKLEIETLKRKENKDLTRINIGTYNFITNTLKAKTPSAVAHEISHWAWFNVLNSADRKAFVADFQRRFYDEKSVPNFYRMAVETSNPIDAVKGPSEMFATRCQDYASDVVMTPTERGLFQKVRDWWNRLFHSADLVHKEGTFEGVTELFDKVWDKDNKRVWLSEGKPIVENIEKIKNKPVFADGDLRRLGDVVDEMTAGPIPDKTDAGVRKEALAETVGLSSMRDRMRALYRDARLLYKVKNEGDKVVGEVKGADNDAVNIKLLRDDRDASKTSLIKQWTMLPRSVFGGTKAEPYWFRLNARDLYYQFMHDQDKILLNNIWRSLGNNEKRINAIRQVIEGKNKNPDPQLLEASMQVKEWLDKKKAKIRTFLLDEYKRELNVTEYNALMDMIAGRDSMDVKAKYGNKINFNVIDDLWKKYKKIQKWGIDDYIPNYEFGRVKIIIKETTEKGKERRHLIAIGLNEYDAVRKIQKHMEETGYKGTYYVDTGASDLFTKPVGISRNQYLGMLGRFQNEMANSIKNINEELAKGIGKTKMREIGRRSIKAAKLYVEPSDKWSPYFEPRNDILKGEEDLKHLLNHYSYSIEKKMALDPVIDDIRTAIKDKVFTDNQAQAFLDIINDVKGSTYWFADMLADSLLHNASSWITKPFKVDFDYRPYASLSSKLATGRKLEANLKLGYRAVASFVNLSSGQIHAITKAGHKYWWDALNFIKTDEGKRFLEQVEPYLGTTLVEKAGQLKSKVPWWKPLGLFQMPEPFNRSVSAAARYLMSREKMGEKAAVEDAIRATWYEQFTYNLASLPRMMREPMGKTVLQFFPYVLNELSFIRSLKPAEWARYASYQFALGGFRGLVMTMKSLPILIGCGWWQEIMDYLDDVGNSIANNVLGGAAYRGMFGAAAALFGETGARAIPEVSGAASISLAPRIGFGGPLFQDIFTLIKTVSSGMPFSFTEKTEEAPYRRLTELRTTPATNEYRKSFERIVAAAAHWNKIWDYWVDQNHHVLDRKLQAIDQVPDLPAPEAVALMADSAMGAESIYHSSMKTARAISDRELERENRRKVGVTQKGVYDFIRGEGLQPDTLNRMRELEMGTEGIERGIEMQSIPLQQRRMPGESWRLYRRRTERFPTYEEEEQR